MTARYVVGDTRSVVAGIADGSVDLVLTSPPFLALRSYLPADHPDKAREIGSEPTPAAYLDVLLELTAEWGRVLAPHGSLCVELGDTYSGSGGGGGDYLPGGLREGQAQFAGSAAHMRESNAAHWRLKNQAKDAWPLPKCLTLIPELYRMALAYGINPLTGEPSPAGRWRIRNVIRWVRPNPPVGALGDKWRPATSEMVVACRAGKRYFDLDATREALVKPGAFYVRENEQYDSTSRRGSMPPYDATKSAGAPPLDWWDEVERLLSSAPDKLNHRERARWVRDELVADAWEITAGGYKGSHYAVFPAKLLVRPIRAMVPERVCTVCGKPSERIVGKATYVNARSGQEVENASDKWVGGGLNRQGAIGRDNGAQRVAETVGWTDCGHGDSWRPGHVLDPFAGTGTTGLVAAEHGRDSTLVDFDARNLELARERFAKADLPLTVEPTLTVTPPGDDVPPPEKGSDTVPLQDSSIFKGGGQAADALDLPDLFPEPPRDGSGRYILAGQVYTRVTTVAKALDPTYLLDRYNERQVANGLREPALYTHLVSLDPNDRDGLNRLCADAKERAGANDRARIGTALHRVMERVDTGQLRLEDVHPSVSADVVAYRGAIADAGLDVMLGWVEVVVAIPEIGVAGTIDRAAMVTAHGAKLFGVPSGTRIAVDLKTSRTLEWSYEAFAMQVALYTRATHLWRREPDALEELTSNELLSRKVGVIVHVPAGTGEAYVYKVDLLDAQVAVDLALEVRKLAGFGKRSTHLVHSENPQAVRDMKAEVLRRRAQRMIEAVPDCGPVIADRFGSIPTFSEALAQGHKYTDAELGTIDAILSEGEAAMGLPLVSDAQLAPLAPEALGAELRDESENPWPPDVPHPCDGEPVASPLPHFYAPRGAEEDDVCWVCRGKASHPIHLLTEQPEDTFAPPGTVNDSYLPDKPGAQTNGRVGIEHYGDPDKLAEALAPGVVPTPTSGAAVVDFEARVLRFPTREPADPTVDAIKEAFPGTTQVSSHRVSEVSEEATALVARINDLPADLRGELDAWARKQGIPNLLTGKATDAQLYVVEVKVGELVAKLMERVDDLHAVVPPENVAGVAAHVLLGPFRGPRTLTRDECEAIKAVHRAWDRSWVTREGSSLFPPLAIRPEIVKAIKANHGSAAAAKLACQRWALALGRPAPPPKGWRIATVKGMADHPIMGPVMALGPAIFTPDAKDEGE